MSSPWQIYKFGGSSLGAPGRLPQVLSLIAQAATPLAVVVSALGDSTDGLIRAGRAAEAGRSEEAQAQVAQVRALARDTAASVLTEAPLRDFERTLESRVVPLERLLTGIALTRECSPATLDEVMGVGEQISAELLALALQARGVRAHAVDARELLLSDATAGAARLDEAASREQVQRQLAAWRRSVPVVTGFIARARTGRTTTLGRNGSDYTATLLARFLEAREVTVWTDVAGVMTADPALVADAQRVPQMTYAEAIELAHFGARIFHPRTMLPLMDAGAVLHIRSTTEPERPGTRIDAVGNPDPLRPTCVTSLERLALLSVESLRASPSEALGPGLLRALEGAGVPVWMSALSALGKSLSVVVPEPEGARAQALLESTLREERARGEVRVAPPRLPVTLVTLVAEAMGQRPNVAGRFFHALGNVGVNVHAIAQGATSRSISCVVGGEDTALAVRTVHAAFNLTHTEINVLLLGKGTVGGHLLKQLEANAVALRERHGVSLRLVGLADRQRAVFDAAGLERPLRQLAEAPGGIDPEALLDALARLPIPVLVDCTGADGMQGLYAAAFAHGVNVVGSNKKPLALPLAEAQALHARAREHFRAYHYETTVGASLPVIETLKNLVRTGDRVARIEGSFSGTLGYLCHQLMAGTPLSEAVRTARALGYTEPHPRDDLSGLDVARKALILARELGCALELEDVEVEPLVPHALLAEEDPERFLRALTAHDAVVSEQVARHRADRRSLRYLARLEVRGSGDARLRVGPVAVDAEHPAMGLRGAEALVAFFTERYRDYPLIVRGAGAGGDVTAAGVLADILRLAQNVRGRR